VIFAADFDEEDDPVGAIKRRIKALTEAQRAEIVEWLLGEK